MSLSLHEQRVLREIGTRLWVDDPVFARQFTDCLRAGHRPADGPEQQDLPDSWWRQHAALGALLTCFIVASVVMPLAGASMAGCSTPPVPEAKD